MSVPQSVDQFLRLMDLGKVLLPEQLRRVMRYLDEHEHDVPTPSALADWAVTEGLLTRWQADKLLSGRHEGFVVGNYRLLDMLGQGAMGTVYLAEHTLMRRRCAVKLLHPTRFRDPILLERFLREGRAAAAMAHPNIVTAYELSSESRGNANLYFLAMELAEGRNLQQVIEEDGVLSARQVVEIALQVAQGLQYAHDQGIIHRDIKPTNLIVNDQGVVKILDLGLAHFFDDSDTSDDRKLAAFHNETFLGTAGYLAPEQAVNSGDIDHRADLYSLGATLYFMLVGQVPFSDGSIVRRMMATHTAPPPNPRALRSELPDDLCEIVMRLLQPNPDDRVQSGAELIDLLKQWQEVRKPVVVATPDAEDSASSRSVTLADADIEGVTREADDKPTHLHRVVLILVPIVAVIVIAVISVRERPTQNSPVGEVSIDVEVEEAQSKKRLGLAEDQVTPEVTSRVAPPEPEAVPEGTSVVTTSPPMPRVLDLLDPANIEAYERRIAERDAEGSIPGLVAIMGDSRLNHWGSIRRAVFRPGTKQLATASVDGTVRLWNTDNGDELRTPYRGSIIVEALAYSPNGGRLALGSNVGEIRMLDAETDRVLWTREPGQSVVRSVLFDPTGRRLLVLMERRKSVLVFDAETGEPLNPLPLSSDGRMMTLSVESQRLAVALNSKRIAVIDLKTDAAVGEFEGQSFVSDTLCFAADGRHLWGGSSALRELLIWDVVEQGEIRRMSTVERLQVVAAGFDQNRYVIGAGWGVIPGQLSEAEMPRSAHGHFNIVRDFAVSDDRQRMASVADDGHIRLWVPPTLQKLLNDKPPYDGLRDISLSQDGSVLGIADFSQVRQIDVATGQVLRRLGQMPSVVNAVAVSPDGSRIAGTSILETDIKVWDAATGTLLKQIPVSGRLQSLCFTPDGTRLVAGCLPNPRATPATPFGGVFDATTTDSLCEFEGLAEDQNSQALAINRTGHLVAGCGRRSVAVWEQETGDRIAYFRLESIKTPPMQCCGFTADSMAVLAGTPDGRLMSWHLPNGDAELLYQHPESVPVTSVAAQPDGEWLAWTTGDGCLQLKRTAQLSDLTIAPLTVRVGPPRGTIFRVMFDSAGTHLLLGNSNGTVFVLRLSAVVSG